MEWQIPINAAMRANASQIQGDIMTLAVNIKYLSAVTLLAMLAGSGVARAAPCVVSLGSTNPDGTLTSATACDYATPIGPGHSPAATQAGVNADNPGSLGLTWPFLDH